MTPSDVVLPDLDALDSEKLKALVVEKHTQIIEKAAELASQQDEIQKSEAFIAKLQRLQFGPSSGRLAHQIDQLELQLEELETNKTAKTPVTVQHPATPAQPEHESHCPRSCRAKPRPFRQKKRPVPIAAAH
jgi:hypothetical protein